VVGTVIAADPRELVETLTKKVSRADVDVAGRLDRRRPRRSARDRFGRRAFRLTEPRVAAELGSVAARSSTLVVASSMPIRDVETFFPAAAIRFRVLSNRGANGSTARSRRRSASRGLLRAGRAADRRRRAGARHRRAAGRSRPARGW
jgi:2-succinyl-5-enolpyruvyl-6-hydroxy-3-cyclohexene-1-carboxylate synthase